MSTYRIRECIEIYFVEVSLYDTWRGMKFDKIDPIPIYTAKEDDRVR